MLERQSIIDAIEIDTAEGISWTSLLRNDSVKTRRRTLLAFAVMVRKTAMLKMKQTVLKPHQTLDQATGINLVVFYIPCMWSRSAS